MKMDRQFINPLTAVASSLDTFIEKSNHNNFERVSTNVGKIMDQLFIYHSSPENHKSPNVFMDSLITAGRRENINFPEVLKNILEKNEDSVFLDLVPFSQNLLQLHDLLTGGFSLNDISIVKSITLQFKGYIAETGIVGALLEMREFAKAAAGLQVDTSVSYNIETIVKNLPDQSLSLAMLSAGINREITPRMQSQPPYNLINWKQLQLLGNKVLEISEHGKMIKDNIDDLAGDFAALANYIDSLVLYERSKYDPSIATPSFAVAPNLDQITNLAMPIIGNSLNLEAGLSYLEHIDSLVTDNSKMNSMAILRVICVLGEISKNLSEDLLSIDNNLFTFLREMRDMIIHANEYPSIQDNIESLIHNSHDQRLQKFASQDLLTIQQFFIALHQHVSQGMVTPSIISDRLDNISALHLSLTKEYKLTLVQKSALIIMLPVQDEIEVSDKRKAVADILQGNANLPQKYEEFAALVEGLGLSKGKMKGLFVKLTQNRLCDTVMHAINGGADDSTLKNLVAKLQFKEPIKQDVLNSLAIDMPMLEQLITSHKEKVRLSDKEIQDLLQKIPVEVMDIKNDKAILMDMIGREQLPSQHDLQRHLDKIGLNKEQKAQFIEAADILMYRKPSLYIVKNSPNSITSVDSAVIKDIDKVQKAINVLRGLTSDLRLLPDEVRFNGFLSQHNLIYACEFAFNIFIDHAKILDSLIDQVRDYRDIRVKSMFLTDPYTKLQQELKIYVTSRNDIFHLEAIYSGFGVEYVERSKLYNMITHRVEGILFPNAIVIAQDSIKEGPVRAASLYNKLQAVSDQLTVKLSVNNHLQEVNLGIKDWLFYIKNFGKVGFFFGKELQEIQKIMHKYDVDILIKNEVDLNKAYKILSLKIHPDKVGNTHDNQVDAKQDYLYVNRYKSLLADELLYKESIFLDHLMHNIYKITHTAAIGIKLSDILVDMLRVANKAELNEELTQKLGSDSLQLYNLYYGFDKYSIGVRLAEIGCKVYNEEYIDALSISVSTISFAAIPTVMSMINPWVGLAYSIAITGYSGYSLYHNICTLQKEYYNQNIKVEDKDAYNVALSIAQEVFGMQPDIQPQCNALTEIAAEKVLDPVMHINNLSEL